MPLVIRVAHTPDPERLIVHAARVCYDSDANDPDADARLIKSLIKRGHESVLEHASMTFKIACSRVVTHELVRHRIAAYSQRSQRYVKEDEPRYYIPNELRGDEPSTVEARVAFIEAMNSAWDSYGDLLRRGLKPEIARYVLPNACLTTIVCTWNFREIRHIIQLRCDKAAQPEMRLVAGAILTLAHEVAPNVFADLKEKFEK